MASPRLLLLGPPASGKGTQARRIAERCGVRHIASGDILRDAAAAPTAEGRRIAQYVERGDLVPDEFLVPLVCDVLVEAASTQGYLLDGFPRSVSQAVQLSLITDSASAGVQKVLYLDVAESELLARMLQRSAVEHRVDDTEPIMRHRLQVFADETLPLVDYYDARGLLHRIDGHGELDAVTERIFTALDR